MNCIAWFIGSRIVTRMKLTSLFYFLLIIIQISEGFISKKLVRQLKPGVLPLPESVISGKSDLNYALLNVKWLRDDSFLTDESGKIVKVGDKNITINLNGVSFERSELSQNGKWLSFYEDVKSIFRHSITSKVILYNLENGQKQYVKVDGAITSQIQIFSWTPVSDTFVIVLKNDLYYGTANDMNVKRVTSDGGDNIFNGIADWVYEEEVFGSSISHWFSPRGKWMSFVKFNDAKVPTIKYQFNSDISSAYPKEYSVHYPKSGYPNPHVELNIITLNDLPTRIQRAVLVCPQKYRESDHILLWTEWVSESVLLAAWSNRVQDEMYVLSYDVQSISNQELRGTQVFHYQTDQWIDSVMFQPPLINEISMKMYYVIPSDEGKDKFLHINEISALTSVNPLQLTSGTWEVNKLICLSAERKKLYYTSNERGFGKNDMYELDLQSMKSKCLTCTNSFNITCNYIDESTSKSCDHSYIKCIGPKIPFSYFLELRSLQMRMVTFNGELVRKMEKYAVPKKNLEKFSRVSHDIYVKQSVPANFDESQVKKYGILLTVYGGPEFSFVKESYQLGFTDYLVSNFPIVEAQVEVIGSGGAGQSKRKAVKNQLGKLESDDIAYMISFYKTLPWVDPDKICIWGWSYGGFLSLTSLARHREVLDCAIAIAPVVDWSLYDSVYTERYMGLLLSSDNEKGYQETSILQKASNFANSSILLIHGLCDDNVHFQNSAKLMNILSEKRISFDQLVIPDQNHALTQRKDQAFKKMTSFLSKKMKFNYPRI